MAFINDLFFKRSSSQSRDSSSGQADFEKPTAFQAFTGTGKYERELRTQWSRVGKEYAAQKRELSHNRRARGREYAESLKERREHYFGKKADRWDLVNHNPTIEDLKNPKVKFYYEEYQQEAKERKKKFQESERSAETELRAAHKENLRKVTADMRSGRRAPQRSRTFFQHLVGASRSGKNNRSHSLSA